MTKTRILIKPLNQKSRNRVTFISFMSYSYSFIIILIHKDEMTDKVQD